MRMLFDRTPKTTLDFLGKMEKNYQMTEGRDMVPSIKVQRTGAELWGASIHKHLPPSSPHSTLVRYAEVRERRAYTPLMGKANFKRDKSHFEIYQESFVHRLVIIAILLTVFPNPNSLPSKMGKINKTESLIARKSKSTERLG